MAERESQRAHDPQPVGEVGNFRRVPGDERRPSRFEGEDLDLILRPHRAERLTVQVSAIASARSPLLARAEVVDEAEDDVVHRLPLRDRDREGEERDAALGVERAVDRVDDDERQPRHPDAADFLRDNRACSVAHTGEDDLLGGPVDRRRVIAAEAFPDHRLALGARGHPREHSVDVRNGGAAEFQPLSQFSAPAPAEPAPPLLVDSVEPTSSGSNSRPDVSFG
jgi:hypothetical protein